jgi:hypothetical protein
VHDHVPALLVVLRRLGVAARAVDGASLAVWGRSDVPVAIGAGEVRAPRPEQPESTWKIPGKGGALRIATSGPPGFTLPAFSFADHARIPESPWQSRHCPLSIAQVAGRGTNRSMQNTRKICGAVVRIEPRRWGGIDALFLIRM